jgi:hypothetical protein
MAGPLDMKALAPPLYEFKLDINIEKGSVRSVSIIDYSDKTVGMKLSTSRKVQGQVIARLGSYAYPNIYWDCAMPRDDGEWHVSCAKV